jgi:hypothetical protein
VAAVDLNGMAALTMDRTVPCWQLKEFRGGLLIVSHDQHFISQVRSARTVS